jgi:glycosyltransferase involved in cell wall biosynthesis
MKHKVVCAMRTKNEEWIINKTLKSLSNFCHSVIIYDDNSEDRTLEICRSWDFVEIIPGAKRDEYFWNAGEQAQILFEKVETQTPDYILMLDADEIPTPSIMDFIDNIPEDINLFKTRMINLTPDEKHYRIDSYRTPSGINIDWNPFSKNAWSKHTLMKYNKDINYTYQPYKIGLGSFGPTHPAPNNVPRPHLSTEDFHIIHYGKISPGFLSGEKQKFYAMNDFKTGKGEYEQRLRHHMICSGFGKEEPRNYVECNPEWFWRNEK